MCTTTHLRALLIVQLYMSTQVEYLLYELREPILLSACWLTLSSEMKVKMPSYVNIYITLASVCDRFYEVVRDKRFRRMLRRHLKGLFLIGIYFVLQ